MNLGITAVVFNNYGRFLNDFLLSISQLKIKPTMITIVLGKDHGVGPGILWPPLVNVIYADQESDLGTLKNIAIENTPTEWIMGMSIDDEIAPWALGEFEKHTKADIIVSKYVFLGKKSLCMHPVISKEVLLSQDYYINGKNYMHGSSPFRRTLWEKYKYHTGDCFNTLFWIDCAAGGATFSHTDVPCLIYNKWDGSHSDIDFRDRLKRHKIINDYRLKKRNETLNIQHN